MGTILLDNNMGHKYSNNSFFRIVHFKLLHTYKNTNEFLRNEPTRLSEPQSTAQNPRKLSSVAFQEK